MFRPRLVYNLIAGGMSLPVQVGAHSVKRFTHDYAHTLLQRFVEQIVRQAAHCAQHLDIWAYRIL